MSAAVTLPSPVTSAHLTLGGVGVGDGVGVTLGVTTTLVVRTVNPPSLSMIRPVTRYVPATENVCGWLGLEVSTVSNKPSLSLQLSGFLAWLMWLTVHLVWLIGFRNRMLVLVNWAWNYMTYERGVRLIRGRR